MPGPGSSILNQLYSVLTEPLWKNILKGLALEAFQDRRPPDLNDESVGSFISRRFGPQLGDNVVSAILHGIYAGDINQLSMKSIQPKLWFWEARHGSIANALAETFREKSKLMSGDDIDLSIELTSKPSLRSILEVMKYTSVFTFKGGVGELVTRLQAKLKDTKNVNIKMNTAISAIRYDEASRGIKVCSHPSPEVVQSEQGLKRCTRRYSPKSHRLLGPQLHNLNRTLTPYRRYHPRKQPISLNLSSHP